MWVLKSSGRGKLLLHMEQGYGFSPVWILRLWIFKWTSWEKALLQTEQRNGFSPVWILLWFFTWVNWGKALLQTEQRYGFSPVWILLWIPKELGEEKLLVQLGQQYDFLAFTFGSFFWLKCCSASYFSAHIIFGFLFFFTVNSSRNDDILFSDCRTDASGSIHPWFSFDDDKGLLRSTFRSDKSNGSVCCVCVFSN